MGLLLWGTRLSICPQCQHPIRAPVRLPADLFLILFPANVPGKAVLGGLSTWAPASPWETRKKLLTLGFGMAQLQPCNHLEKEEVEGVSVGAILSDYQRVRVENVCKRLNLQPLAYLWQRNQEDLLREMIASNVQAVIIKVAAFGLDPDKHLGKTLDQMEPILLELSKKYGVHVCGEGGEYETFTLDCPLFKKKIIVDSSEVVIHSADAFAPVAYLRFLELHLEDKVSPVPDNFRTSNYIHNS
nr:diphthine--ammonia ligase isoform X8 [Oryctolagus cuniculus]